MNYKEINNLNFELIPLGEKINARQIELDKKKLFKVFIFRDDNGSFNCLMEINDNSLKLPKINGLNIQYQLFSELGNKENKYILFECRVKAYLSNFIEILKEIIFEYDNNNLELLNVINKTIAKWRHFLSLPVSTILIEQEIVGLIGELIFLKKLITVYGGNALNYWVADNNGVDFINYNKAIEVKTSLKEKHEHIINGLDQLLIEEDNKKYILSILIRRSLKGQLLNLPRLIEECKELFKGDPILIDFFFEKLKSRGYDIRDFEQYLEFKYTYIRGGYFEVDDNFPKLTTNQLISPLSNRISKLRYTLDLEGLLILDFNQTKINTIFDNDS